MPIRVAVIEDHPLVLRAVVQDLSAQDDIEVVGTAMHGSELYRLVRETSPDVVILDLGFAVGEFEPVNAVKMLRQRHPQVQILVLTAYDNAVWVRELFAAGVRGYVLKSIVTLVASAIPLLSMLLQALYPPHDWLAFWRVLPVYVFVALLPQGKGSQARGTRVSVRFPI